MSQAGGDGPREAAEDLFAAGRELASDASELAALEARLALAAGSRVLALTGLMVITAAAVWGLAQAAAAVFLVGYGAPVVAVLLGLAALNALALLVLLIAVRRLTRHMVFPATRRFLLTGGTHATAETPD